MHSVESVHRQILTISLCFVGAKDMLHAYRDMRQANWKDSDKYFHARGNYDAARRGPGGRWAAEVIRYVRFDMILFLRDSFEHLYWARMIAPLHYNATAAQCAIMDV